MSDIDVIEKAFEKLRLGDHKFVMINDIKIETGIGEDRLSAALRDMADSGDWDVIPESNQKVLPRDAFRMRYGNQEVDVLEKVKSDTPEYMGRHREGSTGKVPWTHKKWGKS